MQGNNFRKAIPVFGKMPLTLALLLIVCALPIARAQNPPAPAPAGPTEDEARAQFITQDAARAAAKEGTDERAKAAQTADRLVQLIAWDEFDVRHYDEAASWFAAHARLNREFYVNESAFYKAVKKPEFDKTQAGLEQAFAKWRAQLAAATDPAKKVTLQKVVNGIPDMRNTLAEGYLAEMETLADGANDLPARLGLEQQDLALRQATLTEMQQIGAPADKIAQQQGRIASSLSSIGLVQERMAQFNAAEKSYRQALALRQSLPADDAERDIVGSLTDLGDLYDKMGDLPHARAFYEQALKAIEDNQPLVQKALAAKMRPEYAGLDQKTVDGFMAERRQELIATNIMSQFVTLNNLAGEIEDMGDYKTALEDYSRALALIDTLPADGPAAIFKGVLRAKALNNIAVAHGASGEIDRATTASAAAFSNKNTYRVYERIVKLLIKMGRAEEAFDYYNRAGSTQLQDALSLASVKTTDTRLQALLDRVKEGRAQQQAQTAQLQAQQSKPKADQDPVTIQNLRYQMAATTKEVLDATDDIRDKYADAYPSIVTVTPTALSDAQPAIPPDVALIEYAPLGDQVYIFVVTHDTLKLYATPVKPDALYARIRAVRDQLTTPESKAPLVARGTEAVPSRGEQNGASLTDNLSALYDMLITPIASEIAAKKTLAFIPTQLLSYLPMQALGRKEGGGLHYLIQDKEIVYLAGADILKAVQPHPAESEGKGLMAFGNPTGANLPFAQSEVNAIARIFPASTTYSGAQATKGALEDAKSQTVRILHFATHGYLDAAHPHKSFIFMANGDAPAGQLTFGEIETLHLDKVDLVTLSACQTALQGEEPKGTEVASLAEAFTRAKAHTIVASLWSVADESTQALMVAFYQNLAVGQSKAAALRAAQLQLLRDPRYAHPYYWAPFILMGDWK